MMPVPLIEQKTNSAVLTSCKAIILVKGLIVL